MSATLYDANAKAHIKIIIVGLLLGSLIVLWVSDSARSDVGMFRPSKSDASLMYGQSANSSSITTVEHSVGSVSIASTIDRSRKSGRLVPAVPVPKLKILVGCELPFSRLIGLSSAALNMRCIT